MFSPDWRRSPDTNSNKVFVSSYNDNKHLCSESRGKKRCTCIAPKIDNLSIEPESVANYDSFTKAKIRRQVADCLKEEIQRAKAFVDRETKRCRSYFNYTGKEIQLNSKSSQCSKKTIDPQNDNYLDQLDEILRKKGLVEECTAMNEDFTFSNTQGTQSKQKIKRRNKIKMVTVKDQKQSHKCFNKYKSVPKFKAQKSREQVNFKCYPLNKKQRGLSSDSNLQNYPQRMSRIARSNGHRNTDLPTTSNKSPTTCLRKGPFCKTHFEKDHENLPSDFNLQKSKSLMKSFASIIQDQTMCEFSCQTMEDFHHHTCPCHYLCQGEDNRRFCTSDSHSVINCGTNSHAFSQDETSKKVRKSNYLKFESKRPLNLNEVSSSHQSLSSLSRNVSDQQSQNKEDFLSCEHKSKHCHISNQIQDSYPLIEDTHSNDHKKYSLSTDMPTEKQNKSFSQSFQATRFQSVPSVTKQNCKSFFHLSNDKLERDKHMDDLSCFYSNTSLERSCSEMQDRSVINCSQTKSLINYGHKCDDNKMYQIKANTSQKRDFPNKACKRPCPHKYDIDQCAKFEILRSQCMEPFSEIVTDDQTVRNDNTDIANSLKIDEKTTLSDMSLVNSLKPISLDLRKTDLAPRTTSWNFRNQHSCSSLHMIDLDNLSYSFDTADTPTSLTCKIAQLSELYDNTANDKCDLAYCYSNHENNSQSTYKSNITQGMYDINRQLQSKKNNQQNVHSIDENRQCTCARDVNLQSKHDSDCNVLNTNNRDGQKRKEHEGGANLHVEDYRDDDLQNKPNGSNISHQHQYNLRAIKKDVNLRDRFSKEGNLIHTHKRERKVHDTHNSECHLKDKHENESNLPDTHDKEGNLPDTHDKEGNLPDTHDREGNLRDSHYRKDYTQDTYDREGFLKDSLDREDILRNKHERESILRDTYDREGNRQDAGDRESKIQEIKAYPSNVLRNIIEDTECTLRDSQDSHTPDIENNRRDGKSFQIKTITLEDGRNKVSFESINEELTKSVKKENNVLSTYSFNSFDKDVSSKNLPTKNRYTPIKGTCLKYNNESLLKCKYNIESVSLDKIKQASSHISLTEKHGSIDISEGLSKKCKGPQTLNKSNRLPDNTAHDCRHQSKWSSILRDSESNANGVSDTTMSLNCRCFDKVADRMLNATKPDLGTDTTMSLNCPCFDKAAHRMLNVEKPDLGRALNFLETFSHVKPVIANTKYQQLLTAVPQRRVDSSDDDSSTWTTSSTIIKTDETDECHRNDQNAKKCFRHNVEVQNEETSQQKMSIMCKAKNAKYLVKSNNESDLDLINNETNTPTPDETHNDVKTHITKDNYDISKNLSNKRKINVESWSDSKEESKVHSSTCAEYYHQTTECNQSPAGMSYTEYGNQSSSNMSRKQYANQLPANMSHTLCANQSPVNISYSQYARKSLSLKTNNLFQHNALTDKGMNYKNCEINKKEHKNIGSVILSGVDVHNCNIVTDFSEKHNNSFQTNKELFLVQKTDESDKNFQQQATKSLPNKHVTYTYKTCNLSANGNTKRIFTKTSSTDLGETSQAIIHNSSNFELKNSIETQSTLIGITECTKGVRLKALQKCYGRNVLTSLVSKLRPQESKQLSFAITNNLSTQPKFSRAYLKSDYNSCLKKYNLTKRTVEGTRAVISQSKNKKSTLSLALGLSYENRFKKKFSQNTKLNEIIEKRDIVVIDLEDEILTRPPVTIKTYGTTSALPVNIETYEIQLSSPKFAVQTPKAPSLLVNEIVRESEERKN